MTRKDAQKLLKKMQEKSDWIEKSVDTLHQLIKAKEIEFARAFLDAFMNKLDTQDNVLLTTENNKRLLASIDKIYAALKSTINSQIVAAMVKDTNHIISHNAEFYGRMSNMSNKQFNAKAKDIKSIVYSRLGLADNGELIKDGFMGGLLDMPEVKNKIKDYSFRGVLTKSGFESFRKGLDELIAGDPDKLGAFSKYHRNYAFDIYNEVDSMNAKMFKDQLDLKYFLYNGGIIKNSRDFCIRKNGRVFSVEETKVWAEEPDNKAKPSNYDPLIHRGGYGCRHSIDYISEAMAFMLRPDLRIAKEFKMQYTSKKGAKVEVHPNSDQNDVKQNVASARVLANNGMNVKILPHSNERGVKNPEYVVNNLLSDLKEPKGNSKNFMKNSLADIKNKGAESVVFNMDNSTHTIRDIKNEITKHITTGRNKRVKEIVFIRGGKAVTISRIEIISRWDWIDKLL